LLKVLLGVACEYLRMILCFSVYVPDVKVTKALRNAVLPRPAHYKYLFKAI